MIDFVEINSPRTVAEKIEVLVVDGVQNIAVSFVGNGVVEQADAWTVE